MGPMRVVVEHSEWGLFLGQGGDKLYWTEKAVTAIIPEPVTFQDREQAEMFCAGHFSSEFGKLAYHEINVDTPYAPIHYLIKAGLGHRTRKLLLFTKPAGFA
jgi:hypothetical protein